VTEDKVSLARKRAELVESLAPHRQLPPEERVCLQGDLSVINAKIKALNTTEAARAKAAADRRKVAGLTEAQANASRAKAKINGSVLHEDEPEDDDPGQTAAIDGWIDAVLLRHDVEFARDAKGRLMVTSDPKRQAPMPQNLAAAIELLVTGVYAAARGQELPELPSMPSPPKPSKAPKPKKR
jgi:hypothetical protein